MRFLAYFLAAAKQSNTENKANTLGCLPSKRMTSFPKGARVKQGTVLKRAGLDHSQITAKCFCPLSSGPRPSAVHPSSSGLPHLKRYHNQCHLASLGTVAW